MRHFQWMNAVLALVGCLGWVSAQAQSAWPQKPIRIVVPFAPGGNTDSIARVIAERFTQSLGQAVVVARCDRTGQGALEDAISLLSGCPNIQLLLNGVHFSPSGRRFGSYYGYRG